MEYTGVEKPMKEKAKISADRARDGKEMALIQGQQQVLMQIAAQSGALAGMGSAQMAPQQVNYRMGENAVQLCANCAFFNGAGVPCKVVLAAIDPVATCDQWQPGQSGPGAGPTGAEGPAPAPAGPPSLFDPSRGMPPPATANPGQTRESVTGMDKSGMGTMLGG